MWLELLTFLAGAVFNLVIAVIITRFIYYPLTQTKTFAFTFIAFNSIVFFVLGLLTSTELGVGVGFGLFAIFSVLRYRTDEMPIREMTYLFVLVALPVVNSVLITTGDYGRLLVTNAFVIILLYVLEKEWGFHFEGNKRITYDMIELITPANEEELLADLRRRTGLLVKWVEIESIDFLRDTAEMKIYYDIPRISGRKLRPVADDERTTPGFAGAGLNGDPSSYRDHVSASRDEGATR